MEISRKAKQESQKMIGIIKTSYYDKAKININQQNQVDTAKDAENGMNSYYWQTIKNRQKVPAKFA